MRLQQIQNILKGLDSIQCNSNKNKGILVAINNNEMSESELNSGLNNMSDNDFNKLIESAKTAYSCANKVKRSFETLEELNEFEAHHECGDRWNEAEKTCVYEYPKFEGQ